MERELSELKKSFEGFLRKWEEHHSEFRNLQREVMEIRRELGVREGKVLADQIENIEVKVQHKEDLLNQISRDVTSARRLLEYNDVNIKEVMKALSLIYKNVDELEINLLPERQT